LHQGIDLLDPQQLIGGDPEDFGEDWEQVGRGVGGLNFVVRHHALGNADGPGELLLVDIGGLAEAAEACPKGLFGVRKLEGSFGDLNVEEPSRFEACSGVVGAFQPKHDPGLHTSDD
jgi:hypothetical protein